MEGKAANEYPLTGFVEVRRLSDEKDTYWSVPVLTWPY